MRLFKESITGAALWNLPIMGWCVLSLLAPELLTALTSDLIWGSHCTWGLYMQCCHSYARGRILLSWIEMNPAALV